MHQVNDVEITPMQEDDIDGVCSLIELQGLIYDNSVDDYHDEFWNIQRKAFFQDAISNKNVLALIARDNGSKEIIGCGVGIISNDDPQCYWIRGKHYGYIRLMRVVSEFRGQGVGAAILAEIMKWFDENNIVDVQLHTSEESKGFYQRHGFHVGEGVEMWRDRPE